MYSCSKQEQTQFTCSELQDDLHSFLVEVPAITSKAHGGALALITQ